MALNGQLQLALLAAALWFSNGTWPEVLMLLPIPMCIDNTVPTKIMALFALVFLSGEVYYLIATTTSCCGSVPLNFATPVLTAAALSLTSLT